MPKLNAQYYLIEEAYHFPTDTQIFFGIVCIIQTRRKMLVIDEVHHISADRTTLLELIERCNTGELSPIHLQDVIEDYQYEQKSHCLACGELFETCL